MVTAIRNKYNEAFTEEKYYAFIEKLNEKYPGDLTFRVAETPVFVSKDFTKKMLNACEEIIDVILKPDFIEKTAAAVPPDEKVPSDIGICHFINLDFGICINEQGEYEPQLVEMQGFPTIYAFEAILDEAFHTCFDLPEGYSKFLNGMTRSEYLTFIKETILGNQKPENVILLEIFPEQQNSRIDFRYSEAYFGIKTVCLTELVREGNQLYYWRDGVKTAVRRIYNRIIFDDLRKQTPEVREKGKLLQEDLAVEWVTHPDWFYRISKFTLPLISHPYVPYTQYLNKISFLPDDLENYVLKPLFSFSGYGVIIDITPEDIRNIKDPENWILQRKVQYADVIEGKDGEKSKAEIRIFYVWKDGMERPVPVSNLTRMSKGKMVGVRYNQNKAWVGSTCSLFEME